MRILVIMHISTEGPGTLGDFLESQGAELTFIRLYDGERLPTDIKAYQAVVSLGGPMNIYEYDKYPFLEQEHHFLKRVLDLDIPLLGICLGAQMIAHACGGHVTRSPREEIGWGSVSLTEEGENDPFFGGIPRQLEVLQWHGDMFHLPPTAKLLVTGEDCPNQAFRCGKAYGLQFHVEVTEEILSQWFSQSELLPDMLKRLKEIDEELSGQALTMYGNFVNKSLG